MSLFSRRLSDQEITDYLGRVSPFELDVVSIVVLEAHLTDKGLKRAAVGRKLLKKHAPLFQGCDSGSDLGARVHQIVGKWPDVSSSEAALVSDLVKAHRARED